MKKITGAIIVLVIIILLGAYYGMGMMTERTVQRNLATLNQSEKIKVKVVNYHRGWFKSTALLEWSFHVPTHIVKSVSGQQEMVSAADYELQMPLNIYHGPIIFANKGIKFGMGYASSLIPFPKKYQAQFDALFTKGSIAPQWHISILVGYLGKSHVKVAIPAFKLEAKEGGEFEWLGMHSSVDVSHDVKKLKGAVVLDGTSFAKDFIKAKMGQVHFDYNLHQGNAGLYLGDTNFSLASLRIDKQYAGKEFAKLFELSNLDIKSSSDGEKGLFASKLALKLDNLWVQEKQYGPAELKLGIKNLDAAVIARIKHALQQAKRDDEAANQRVVLAILPEIPKLLAHAAEFEISDLSFVMPEGKIEGNLSLKLPKGDHNPFELLYKMQGNGRLKVPAVVVKSGLSEFNRQRLAAHLVPSPALPSVAATPTATPTPTPATEPQAATQAATSTATEATNAATATSATSTPAATNAPASTAPAPATSAEDIAKQTESLTQTQLGSMLQSGLLVEEGDYYVIDVAFNDGKLVINGKPFNSAMLRF